MNKPDVIVVSKNYSTNLGVIRALGEAKYPVYVVNTSGLRKKRLPDMNSCYVKDGCCTHGDDQLGEILNGWEMLKAEKKVIIPADDSVASWLDMHQEELEGFLVPTVKNTTGTLTDLMDKAKQKELAAGSGLTVVNGWSIPIGSDGSYQIPKEVVYPCYTKPQISIGSPKTYIKKCADERELKQLLDEVASFGENVILAEQYLEINTEYVVSGIGFGKQVFIPAFMKKIRIGSGRRKGVTAMAEIISVEKMQELHGQLIRFMQAVEMYGIFDIEIIESNGVFYFNELNLRPSAANYGLTAAGVNLPAAFAEYAVTGVVPEIENKVQNGMIFVSEKVESEDLEAGFISWKQYRQHIKMADVCFIFSKKDMKPWLIFQGKLLKAIGRKLLKK